MLIPKGPHRTFKKKTTKKGVPRQSSYTLSSRERRRAQERRARQEGQAPLPQKSDETNAAEERTSIRIEYKQV